MSNSKISGSCFAMCPDSERTFREREGLLSILEVDEKTKHYRYPKADAAKIVKCYRRCSAGTSPVDPSELRPGSVLLFTLKYLLTTVLLRTDVNWRIIYEYVFDRIRAIKQDMTIQRLEVSISIMILEPIVRFHIYSAERMREKDPAEFVSKFNDQHLLESIKQLLVLYDERDENKTQDLYTFRGMTMKNNRSEMEAMYLLLYLGDANALARGLSLPVEYRKSTNVVKAINISLAWFTRNYVRVCRQISQLPLLFAMAALNNLRLIRRNSFQIMSSGYNSKSLTFPCSKVKDILLYKDINKVSADCKLFHVNFVDDNIHFQKSQFDGQVTLASPEKYFSDKELNNFLPDLFDGTT